MLLSTCIGQRVYDYNLLYYMDSSSKYFRLQISSLIIIVYPCARICLTASLFSNGSDK